jgi:hypothetical protein
MKEISMRRRQHLLITFALAAGFAAAFFPVAARAQVSRPAPAGAAQPRQVTDLASAVGQTAAVIEGVASEIRYEFSEAEGPWTRVVLSDVKSHFGAAPAKVELLQFGGMLPNGRLMVAAELPVFVKGYRYLVFLRNTAWNLSPVVGSLAFRVDAVGGAEVLVSSDGHAVTGVDTSGTEFGAALFEPTPYAGGAAAPKAGGMLAFARKPMDRRRFVAALRALLDEQGLKAAGPFYEHPAGGFKWRGQAVVPHGQKPAAGAGRAEIDPTGTGR